MLHFQRSPEMPFTHPLQVQSFKVVVSNDATYVVTAGGEGNIRTWRFNQSTGMFEHLSLMEGHFRGVNSIVITGIIILLHS